MSLLAVDGNSVAWRTFHAMGGLSGGGMATGMAFGFLKMLRNAIAAVQADSCRVAWDGGRPVFRTAAWSGYKAGRTVGKSDPDEVVRRALFTEQQTWLRRVLPSFGVAQALFPGWEADDVVAMWVVTAGDRRVAVMSGDRDLWQLVSQNVVVVRPGEPPLTMRNFAEVAGVPTPEQWLWFRILSGDGSDGIPGVGGVGDKRGRRLVTEHWPVRRLLAELTPTRRTLAARNFTLMNLRRSGMDLYRAIHERTRADPTMPTAVAPNGHDADGLYRLSAGSRLDDARRALAEAEMRSLTGSDEWGEWSAPFRRLREDVS